MPIISNPLGLAGLIALPLLLGIYLLRRRYRRQPVSALFLWNHALPPRLGGTRLHFSRLPWIFLLELLILSLLALAAADPLVGRRGAGRELLVVLDASIAMRAPGTDGKPAMDAALSRLHREFRAESWRRIRVVEGRARPGVRVDAGNALQAATQLAGFNANAPARDLAPALALANRLAGSADALLVITDRPPPQPLGDQRLRWVALGAAYPNLAIVDALRGPAPDGAEICLVEIANFSDTRQDVELRMEYEANAPDDTATSRRQSFSLAPGGRRRARLTVANPGSVVRLRLEPADVFDIDNHVDLSPVPELRVPVALHMDTATPHAMLLKQTLRAADRVQIMSADRRLLTAASPVLTFRDAADGMQVLPAWTVVWHRPAEAKAFRAPFLRGIEHPLIEELRFDGIWWGAKAGYPLPGRPLLSLGDGSPLLTVTDGPVIHFQWVPELSDLQRTPGWPILIDNLLTWHAASLPRGQPRNLPLGAHVTWNLPRGEAVRVHHPDHSVSTLESQTGSIIFQPSVPGRYAIELPGDDSFLMSVNLFAPGVSDLRERGAGEWGDRFSPSGRAVSHVSIARILLLAAVILASAHAWATTSNWGDVA